MTKGLYREYMRDCERDFLLSELEARGYNVKGTAEDLGMPLATLKYRIRLLNIYVREHRNGVAFIESPNGTKA